VDFDADGIDDVITGSIYEDIYLFLGLGGGKFAKPRLLKDKQGKPLTGGYCCTTELLDMDADGDLDLVCATRVGKAKWFLNIGTRSSPQFDAESRSLPMVKGARPVEGSNATYTDWDGDGIRDLVAGSEWGRVVWYRNTGKDNKPRFAAAQQLLRNPGFVTTKEGDVPQVHGSRAKVCIVDYDNDGLRDILLGDFTSCTYSTRPPLTQQERKQKKALEKDLAQKQNKAYYKEVNQLSKQYWDAKKAGKIAEVKAIKARQQALRRPLDELYRKLQPFRTTGYKSHGWVWLYRQLPKAETSLATDVLAAEPVARTGEVTLRTLTTSEPVQPGQTFQVAVNFQIASGWHIYGPRKSDSYLPTTIKWELPTGCSVQRVAWPDPVSVPLGDSVKPIYNTTTTALVTIAVAADAKLGTRLKCVADVSWQVCQGLQCKPGGAKIETSVQIGSAAVPNAADPGGR